MSEGAVLLESRSRTHGSQGGAGAFPPEGVPPWGGAGRPERGGRLPGQACTKQGWLRSRSGGQLPPGRGGRSSSRRWKARPRPQLWLQLLQPDQGVRPQSTAGTGGPGSDGGSSGSGPSPGRPLTPGPAQPRPYHSRPRPSRRGSQAAGRSAARRADTPHCRRSAGSASRGPWRPAAPARRWWAR